MEPTTTNNTVHYEHCTLRPLLAAELRPAMELAWRVFLEMEAPVTSAQHIEQFRVFLEGLADQTGPDGLLLWGSFLGNQLTGVLGVIPPAHVCLLSVDKVHFRRAIARSLLQEAWLDMCRASEMPAPFTANVPKYAVDDYLDYGFQVTHLEQIIGGVPVLPMQWEL